MDWTPIFTAAIGGGVVTVVVKMLLERIFKKHDDKDEILKALRQLQAKSNARDLTDSKEILLILLAHHKNDQKAILDEADRYFIELGGDSWVFDKVKKWAKNKNVDIDYLESAHEANLKKNRSIDNNKRKED